MLGVEQRSLINIYEFNLQFDFKKIFSLIFSLVESKFSRAIESNLIISFSLKVSQLMRCEFTRKRA